MENTSSIKQIITDSLEKVRTFIDADTIVGKQIVTPSGTVIIPISKVTMGFASGGLDLPAGDKKSTKNFGGGGGTGVTVTPIGFLTVFEDGTVEMLNMNQEKAGPIEQIAEILDSTPEIISRVKGLFVNSSDEDVDDMALDIDQMIEESNLSKKELKKLRRQQAKEAKKAEKL